MPRITVAETAKLLNVSEQRVRELCHSKKIKAKKFSRVWEIDKKSAEDYRDSK